MTKRRLPETVDNCLMCPFWFSEDLVRRVFCRLRISTGKTAVLWDIDKSGPPPRAIDIPEWCPLKIDLSVAQEPTAEEVIDGLVVNEVQGRCPMCGMPLKTF